jgi:hypothetical protein
MPFGITRIWKEKYYLVPLDVVVLNLFDPVVVVDLEILVDIVVLHQHQLLNDIVLADMSKRKMIVEQQLDVVAHDKHLIDFVDLNLKFC